MRLSRAALALLVLITMVVGAPANAHARLRDDVAATATADELSGPPCIEIVRIEISPVVRTESVLELAVGPAPGASARAAILTTAPKTSPPACRS